MASKSPFYIAQDMISPLLCEEIIDQLGFETPNYDKDNKPMSSIRTEADYEAYLFELFERKYRDKIHAHYGTEHRATSEFTFHWFPEGSRQKPQAENSEYVGKKWYRTKDRDLTAILFLSDYIDDVAIDPYYEVYGGKLEFPQHGFGFKPQRGTMIVFPSVPHFINVVTPIEVGSLHFAKFHIAAATPFLFDPKQFPGDYRTWLREFG